MEDDIMMNQETDESITSDPVDETLNPDINGGIDLQAAEGETPSPQEAAISDEIDRVETNISDSYAVVGAMGGTIPIDPNSDNLPNAIRSLGGDTTVEEVTMSKTVAEAITWAGNLPKLILKDYVVVLTDASLTSPPDLFLDHFFGPGSITFRGASNSTHLFKQCGVDNCQIPIAFEKMQIGGTAVSDGPGIAVTAANIILKQCTLIGNSGILADGASNLYASQCVLSNLNPAVSAQNNASVLLDNCTMESNTIGAIIDSAATVRAAGTTPPTFGGRIQMDHGMSDITETMGCATSRMKGSAADTIRNSMYPQSTLFAPPDANLVEYEPKTSTIHEVTVTAVSGT